MKGEIVCCEISAYSDVGTAMFIISVWRIILLMIVSITFISFIC